MLPDDDALCTFCWAIRNDPRNLYRTVVDLPVRSSYLLYSSPRFVVIPEIGSFEPGYLIVAPKAHILSFGHLETTYDVELALVLRDVAEWVVANFRSNCIMFEHGPVSPSQRGGACTDHAHLHVAPVPDGIDLRQSLEAHLRVRRVPEWLPAAREQVARQMPYLFLRHTDASMWICDAPQARSQEFRRDLVLQLGLDDIWDWAAFPGSRHIVKTIQIAETSPLDTDRAQPGTCHADSVRSTRRDTR